MSEIRREIDRHDVHPGLGLRRAYDTDGSRSPEEVKRILRDRAQALATPLAEVRHPAEMLELLVFLLAGDRYGIEMSHVLEVIPMRGLTLIPCTPPFVRGVINHRGRILPVLDVRRLLDLSGQGGTEGGRVVAVQAMRMIFGIVADGVERTVQVAAQDLSPSSVILTREHQAMIRGVTNDMVAVLDLEALARDRRIVVNDEVG